MPIVSDYVNDIMAATALTSSAVTTELRLANQKLEQFLYITIAGAASLVGGLFFLEGQIIQSANNTSGTWIKFPATYYLVDADSGTPAAVAGNTASATMIVGGACSNTTGVTNITDNGHFIVRAQHPGVPLRISYKMTSGAATIAATTWGLTAVSG